MLLKYNTIVSIQTLGGDVMAKSTLEEVLASEAKAVEVAKEYEQKIDDLSKEKAKKITELKEESKKSVKAFEQSTDGRSKEEIASFNAEQEEAINNEQRQTAEQFAQKENKLVTFVVEEMKKLYVNS